MIFKQFSKIIGLSLAILVACSISIKAENPDSKINRVRAFSQVMVGVAYLAVLNQYALQPLSQLAFSEAKKHRDGGGSPSAITLLNTTGYTLKYCAAANLLMANITIFPIMKRTLFGSSSGK